MSPEKKKYPQVSSPMGFINFTASRPFPNGRHASCQGQLKSPGNFLPEFEKSMVSGQTLRMAVAYVLVMLGLLGLAPYPGFAELVINEVMADPASDWDGDGAYQYRDDEWVEILNTGPDLVDLSLYGLRDASSDDPRLRLSGTLEPGQVQVFFGSEAVVWQQEQGNTVAGLSLNNGGDILELLFLGESEAQVVDTVTYLDHEGEDDRSSGLGADNLTWQLFDALNPHAGTQEPLGTGCAPTPGAANLCSPQVANENLALDSLKSCYR